MKFRCSREELLSRLNIAVRITQVRSTMPVLSCVLLEAERDCLKIYATDLQIGIITSPIPAEIKVPGSIAVEGRFLLDFIKGFTGNEVEFSTDEKNLLTLSSGGSNISGITARDGEEFPAIKSVESDEEIVLPSALFKSCIKKTIFSVSSDPARPTFCGELLEFTGGKLNVVSVDGYRISIASLEMEDPIPDKKVIIPTKPLAEIARTSDTEENETIVLRISDKHALFETTGATIVTRRIEGEFLKYESSFPTDWKTELLLRRDELLSSLERAFLISRDSTRSPVMFNMEDGALTINAASDGGRLLEDLPVKMSGAALRIAFNPKFLLEPLRSLDSEEIILRFNTQLSPCVILPGVAVPEERYMVLPLRQ